MKYKLHNFPFKHIIAEPDDVFKSCCSSIYEQCIITSPVDDMSLLEGTIQANSRVTQVAIGNNDFINIDVMRIVEEIREQFYTEVFGGEWCFNLRESYIGDDEEGELWPHTDDPKMLHELFGRKLNDIGILKFLIYLGDLNITYNDYGTKLYTCASPNTFELAKEVPFIPGTMLLWKPGPDTFHGTDFLEKHHRRFSITGEYLIP